MRLPDPETVTIQETPASDDLIPVSEVPDNNTHQTHDSNDDEANVTEDYNLTKEILIIKHSYCM